MNIKATNRNSVIILAAGNSRRLGTKIPKPYLRINNREIIDYSIQTFKSIKEIHEIILVVSEEYVDKIKKKYPKCIVIIGGKNRKDSSYNGLLACSKNTNKVLIHDAARPFIDSKLINDCINTLDDYDAVTLGVPSIDTIAECEDFNIKEIKNRKKQILIQTPQGFIHNKIKLAHEKFNEDTTDDIKIMLKDGYKCKLIIGSNNNFKITHNRDLFLAKMMISESQIK